MPEMDLSGDLWCLDLGHDPDDPEGDEAFIDLVDWQVWWKLCAYAGWPNSPDQRQEFIAKFYAMILGQIENGPPDDAPLTGDIEEICDAVRQCVDKSFRLAGGWSALQSRLFPYPKSLLDPGDAPHEAGMILGVLRSISEKHADVKGVGSVNKAIHVMDYTKKQFGWRGETSLWRSWNNYKSVAHINFAFHAAAQAEQGLIAFADNWAADLDEDEKGLAEHLVKLFIIARDYQDFAVKHNIVDRAIIWAVPDIAKVWTVSDNFELPDAPPAILTMTEDMLEALRKYSAPI
jgi:hypothetical protein